MLVHLFGITDEAKRIICDASHLPSSSGSDTIFLTRWDGTVELFLARSKTGVLAGFAPRSTSSVQVVRLISVAVLPPPDDRILFPSDGSPPAAIRDQVVE